MWEKIKGKGQKDVIISVIMFIKGNYSVAKIYLIVSL